METKIRFHTNLDEVQGYVSDINSNWEGDIYPVVVDKIAFDKHDDLKFIFELEVKAVRFKQYGSIKEIELHIPSYYGNMSLDAWCEWFKRH